MQNTSRPTASQVIASSSSEYRDRASERRAIHHQEDQPGLMSQSEIDSRNNERARELRFDWLCGKVSMCMSGTRDCICIDVYLYAYIIICMYKHTYTSSCMAR
jgi:hypothetical protein